MLPKRLIRGVVPVLLVLVATVPLLAQESMPGGGLSDQSMRPYRFVFYAYALAWIFILGWIVSVARRMARLDRRLGD